MILVDANVFMYASGTPHPHKAESRAFVGRVARGDLDAAIDAEVLQEILHRYRAIGRWKDGRRVYDLVRRVVAAVVPVTGETLDDARALLDRYRRLLARDALHAAACRLADAEAIVSYDRDLDGIDGVTRREPRDYLQ